MNPHIPAHLDSLQRIDNALDAADDAYDQAVEALRDLALIRAAWAIRQHAPNIKNVSFVIGVTNDGYLFIDQTQATDRDGTDLTSNTEAITIAEECIATPLSTPARELMHRTHHDDDTRFTLDIDTYATNQINT